MLASVTDFRRSGLLTITGNPKDRVACSELYAKYSDWYDEIGGQKLSKRAFWQGLEELGVGRSRSSKTRFYTGIELPSWKKKINPLDKNETASTSRRLICPKSTPTFLMRPRERDNSLTLWLKVCSQLCGRSMQRIERTRRCQRRIR